MHHRLMASAIVAAFAFNVPAQAQVTNGGFETGDFTGWSTSDLTVFDAVDFQSPHTGDYSAYFGAPTLFASISQILATTPGQAYTISFWLKNEQVGNNGFIASFGGNTLTTLTDADAFGYTEYSFTRTASAASTEIAFSFLNTDSFWDFDDVSVAESSAAVPEPATWATMLLGFGAIGAAMRRKARLRIEALQS